MKKEWDKPQLIVLVRGCAEERVLSNCKGNGSTSSIAGFHTSCAREMVGGNCTSECLSQVLS
jgi:hypothetical protein